LEQLSDARPASLLPAEEVSRAMEAVVTDVVRTMIGPRRRR
jgi:hypothetical protein